jgi:tRNA(Ile)-lysidine synthase
VAHLDHALRPDSEQDAQFVGRLASEMGFAAVMERIDVAGIARQKRQNLEATARTLRYAFLTRVARQHQAQAIFTAHTLNDQAETILLQLLRGTAQAVGIRARVGRVCRPLLAVTRQELQGYLQQQQLSWREDPTNAEVDLDRNYLRHQVLPALLERFPSTLEQLGRYALAQQEQLDTLNHLGAQIIWPDQRWPVPAYRIAPLLSAQPAVRKQALKRILQAHRISLTAAHLQQLETTLQHTPTTLPGGWQAERSQGSLFLIPPQPTIGSPWRPAQPGETLARSFGHQRLVEFLAQQGIPAHLRRGYPVQGQPIEQVRGLWPPSPDDRYMAQALQLARQAAQQGEVPVGCLVVLPQGVMGASANQVETLHNACAHAELLALQQAMQATSNKVLPTATVYVTLEPCLMCMGALMEAQIGRLVYGCANPKAGALSLHGLRPPFAVEGGRKEQECAKLLSGFFAGLRPRNSS